ncbi:MAG: hypothetical protein H7066_02795 [Cytophagaceae bacterium]|nr:hypothetical protein [Gemmatimonadaceae bacterium]
MKETITPLPITKDALAELTAVLEGPCLSIYQPTHRRHPENQQDPIRFRQLMKTLETSLRLQESAEGAKSLLAPFEALGEDRDFWNHTLDGLAVLGARGLFRVFLLARPVAELAVVADSFHTKPLRRFLQSAGRFHVLGLSLHEVHLFEGDRNALERIELSPGVPRTMTEALGEDVGQSPSGGSGRQYGHGSKKEEIDNDATHFFRAVDRAVLEHHSRPSGLPLILAALPEHHAQFRAVSHNPLLMEEGVMVNPDALSADELRARAWEVAQPQHLAREATWTDAFGSARAKGLGSEDLSQVAEAAVAGRVATLLIESERQIAGRIDAATGQVAPGDLADPHVDDVLDDLGALVEKMGGEVHVLPTDRMPTSTGLAATFRH